MALRPDDRARVQLDALARAQQRNCPGSRRVGRENLHLTLAFIGQLDAPAASRVIADLAAFPASEFDWMIDHVAGFERARVAWAGGPPEARLDELAQAVRAVLDKQAVSYDRKAFVAHVTLLRQAAGIRLQVLGQPIPWRVTSPVLMVSQRDPRGRTRYISWSVYVESAGLATEPASRSRFTP